MQEMTEQDEQVKTGIDEILSIVESDLSDAQKLVAILVAAGVSDKAEIAKRLGKSVRSIEPHYATLRIRGYAYSRNADTRIHVSKTCKNEVGTLPALNTESPTEILFASKGGCGGSFEIPGLNGATGALVEQLACLLAGPLGSPNFLDARVILSSQVAAYGPEKVRAAMAEWQVKVRLKKSNPTLSTFLGFCKNAKTHFENQNDTRNILDVLAEMDAREAIQ